MVFARYAKEQQSDQIHNLLLVIEWWIDGKWHFDAIHIIGMRRTVLLDGISWFRFNIILCMIHKEADEKECKSNKRGERVKKAKKREKISKKVLTKGKRGDIIIKLSARAGSGIGH